VLAKKRRLKRHHELMGMVIIIAFASTFAVMLPSLLNIFSAIFTFSLILQIIIILHALFGIIALSMGLTFLIKSFKRMRILMRILFVSWSLALATGLVLYFLLYW
jgi:uncharacterized membrane protein YozB (DUF420 family)